MSNGTYTARVATHAHVYDAIMALPFPPVGKRYNANHANATQLDLARILHGTFNAFGGGQGMKGLLRSSTDLTNPSRLSAIKSTDVATADSILDDSTKEAAAANKRKKPEIRPSSPK